MGITKLLIQTLRLSTGCGAIFCWGGITCRGIVVWVHSSLRHTDELQMSNTCRPQYIIRMLWSLDTNCYGFRYHGAKSLLFHEGEGAVGSSSHAYVRCPCSSACSSTPSWNHGQTCTTDYSFSRQNTKLRVQGGQHLLLLSPYPFINQNLLPISDLDIQLLRYKQNR